MLRPASPAGPRRLLRPMAAAAGPEQEQPRRWSARQHERVHLAEIEDRRYLDRPVAQSGAEQTYRAALARARAEKRARRRN
ncbi:hypothetical protein [Streptomyces sp. NPDC053720]|uniref:hypothetical protein n=1 Tax=Streptomyces sp. NPDC053720 TaxID=3154855 RepID=UPI00342A41DE